MAKKSRFYVVWRGHNPGVYDNWDDARLQVEGFPNPQYKAFNSSQEAAMAYRKTAVREENNSLAGFITKAMSRKSTSGDGNDWLMNPEIDPYAWAVDAACSGNPGKMEYRGVELISGKEIFRIGPFDDATNNIGEFLAIVHALALMFQKNERHTIYSDSVSGMAWVRDRRIKTQLQRTPRNGRVFELIERAISWLNTHSYDTKILKWNTREWGEIPADFGRKK